MKEKPNDTVTKTTKRDTSMNSLANTMSKKVEENDRQDLSYSSELQGVNERELQLKQIGEHVVDKFINELIYVMAKTIEEEDNNS